MGRLAEQWRLSDVSRSERLTDMVAPSYSRDRDSEGGWHFDVLMGLQRGATGSRSISRDISNGRGQDMGGLRLGRGALGAALALAIGAVSVLPALAAATTVVVHPGDMRGWFFYNDGSDSDGPERIDNSLGTFVEGPGNPPAGTGSAKISVTADQRRNLATYQFSGMKLADIQVLQYSTFNPSAGNGGPPDRAGYLQFNVDFNGTDTWQRRLVFLPKDNGTILQDTWQPWDGVRGGAALWRYSGPTWPNTAMSGSTPRIWSDILASYPGVRIRVTDSWLGIRVGEPYANGYTENLDAFRFGIGGNVTTFDFEATAPVPADKDQCKGGGWQTFKRTDGSPMFKNQGDCVSFVATGGKNKPNGR